MQNKDIQHYAVNFGQNFIQKGMREYFARCKYCCSQMEMSECGSVCICHNCEIKVNTLLIIEFWEGFYEMERAMEAFFCKNPHLKIKDERYDEDEVFYRVCADYVDDDAAHGRHKTVRFIGKDYIRRGAKRDKDRFAIKPKPMVIWYPNNSPIIIYYSENRMSYTGKINASQRMPCHKRSIWRLRWNGFTQQVEELFIDQYDGLSKCNREEVDVWLEKFKK